LKRSGRPLPATGKRAENPSLTKVFLIASAQLWYYTGLWNRHRQTGKLAIPLAPIRTKWYRSDLLQPSPKQWISCDHRVPGSGAPKLSYDLVKILHIAKQIFLHRALIDSMARRDLSAKYAGSFLGWMWSFIQPFVMILVFWFIFSVGFRVKPTNDVPFVVWLTAGMAAWFVFAEIVNGSPNLVVSISNLVKKTLFPSEILPVINVLIAVFSHGIFVAILLGLLLTQGLPLSIYFFQAIYYLCCLIALSLGLSWAIAAVHVFIRDVGQIVGVLIQVGFWGTPIFWDAKIMSPKIQLLLKCNPMHYVVQGYRDSFIYFTPFWHHPYETLYFWLFTATMLVAGGHVFMKLKPQFADVL
jgi:ABC-type polysaccharide/polyol phosphate export permease